MFKCLFLPSPTLIYFILCKHDKLHSLMTTWNGVVCEYVQKKLNKQLFLMEHCLSFSHDLPYFKNCTRRIRWCFNFICLFLASIHPPLSKILQTLIESIRLLMHCKCDKNASVGGRGRRLTLYFHIIHFLLFYLFIYFLCRHSMCPSITAMHAKVCRKKQNKICFRRRISSRFYFLHDCL